MLASLRERLLAYHRARQFRIYESFPLVTDDPTLLFTNATITPFKRFFQDPAAVPHDYALVQTCLRVGGGAGGLSSALEKQNYSSLFEMFGSGIFGRDFKAAVGYFLDFLSVSGIEAEKLRFTIPAGSSFGPALHSCGVPPQRIFSLEQNGAFWREWRFGKEGLCGEGLTAVYSHRDEDAASADAMANSGSFTEIGNLIHICGQIADGKRQPIPHEGFEVGLGLGRLATILSGCSLYEIDPWRELANLVRKSYAALGALPPQGEVRVLVDHLRAIDALILCGVVPGNKRHAFVLRKLIRSFLETSWTLLGSLRPMESVVREFAQTDVPGRELEICGVVRQEERQFIETLRRGKRILDSLPEGSGEKLKETYGIRPHLCSLL